MNRRSFFFFGLMGASAAALSARLNGIPIPQARVQVIAKTGDRLQIIGAKGDWLVKYENAKLLREPFDPQGEYKPAGELLFQAHQADISARINGYVEGLNILGVFDAATKQPLRYRVVRKVEAEKILFERGEQQRIEWAAEREAQAQIREGRRQKHAIEGMWGPNAVVASGIVVPAGMTRIMDPGEKVFVDVPERVARLSPLIEKYPTHPVVVNAWERAIYGHDKWKPRLPA